MKKMFKVMLGVTAAAAVTASAGSFPFQIIESPLAFFLLFLSEMPKPANYFPAIDGLRLLASLNIVMLHLGSSSALAWYHHLGIYLRCYME